MTKAELESKHLSELHALAAEAGIAKYRMLTRAELIGQLGDGDGGGTAAPERSAPSRSSSEARERPPRPRRRRRSGAAADEAPSRGSREPRGNREPRQPRQDRAPAEEPPAPEPETPPASAGAPAESSSRPRRRRRRRFGRRGKDGVTIHDLLLPAEAGRQAILCAETREGCTALLRGVAADLAAAPKGPDPVVLLIDPSPEELADWKREAPQAEIVAAGQARHASDALAQAATRAGDGEDVMLLVDSLTRLATGFADTDAAKQFFDAGRAQGAAGGGSLTVVVALETS
ncbi:MAG TPA: Rho termination factor N-terminal domain-containing protein [Solirubrobacterales bacterium]|jgi:hypothetical protein|nr:Rho termination factor N-terminal domain-containing protein [Solirubrobacterales bacterium]